MKIPARCTAPVLLFLFVFSLFCFSATNKDDYYGELYNSILLSYEYRPGTVFYLGLDDNQEKDGSGIFRSEGRYYFIKFPYWWRI